MVERLKQAIEKARLARENRGESALVASQPSPGSRGEADRLWAGLPPISSDRLRLERNRVVTLERRHPAHMSFDRLRTRILRVCRDNGWSQIAITSANRASGKTMVSANLALSIARNPSIRALLVELDMRAPSLRRMLGVDPASSIDALLTGEATPEQATARLSPNLALCMARGRVANSAELLSTPSSLQNLARLRQRLAPDVVLYDLPPLFGCDDALAFLPNADAVLLVAAAGATTADSVSECERLIGSSAAILGVVLNKAGASEADAYGVEYGDADVSV